MQAALARCFSLANATGVCSVAPDMKFPLIAPLLFLLAGPAAAAPLQPALSGLAFLVGNWSGGHGKVADTGGTSTGWSAFTAEANGGVLLRRDHTDLSNAAGAPVGGFDQIMMIYPEGRQIHAEYADGRHLIHYVSAVVDAGRAVTFTSAAQPGAPVFTLNYTLTGAKTLAVSFAMATPGGGAPRPIATGTMTRRP